MLIIGETFIPVDRVLTRLYEPWMAIVVVVMLALFAVVKRQFPSHVQLMGLNFSNYRIARQTFDEGEFSRRPEWFISLPGMVAGPALLLSLIAREWSIDCTGDSAHLFARLMTIIALVYVLKVAAANVVAALAHSPRCLRNYLGNTFLLMQTIALPLMFLGLVAALTAGWVVQAALAGGLALFALTYFLRIVRGIQAALEERIELNYIILYLCTLEFIPLAVMVKAWLHANTHC